MPIQSRRRFLKFAATGAIIGAAGIFGGLEALGYFNQPTSFTCQQVNPTATFPNTDDGFFIEPYQTQINQLVNWLNTPWVPASGGYGFDSNYQLIRGGNWPGYVDSSTGKVFQSGYHPGMVLIDSNYILAKTLDWFNSQSGRTPTNIFSACSNYLYPPSSFVDPALGANATTAMYNGLDRRELFLGKLSVWPRPNAVYQTASQIWYLPGHTLNDISPIVTALPTTPIPNQPEDMEYYAPQILLEYLNNEVEQAKLDFLNVISHWQPGCPGQIGGPYGGSYTSRCLSFTIVVARCCKDTDGTPFWLLPNVQPVMQQIIDSLWAIQQGDGGIPTSYNPPFGVTPESTGEALLAFDPNLPSRFS